MNKLGRLEFIRRSLLALTGTVLVSKFSSGRDLFANLSQEKGASGASGKRAISDFGIVDLHCHPSLKMHLWNKKLWKKSHTSAGSNPFGMQYTVDELSSGYVKGLLVAHYLFERDFFSNSEVVRKFFPLLERRYPGLMDKVEHKDYSNFTQINVMIDVLETQIHLANQKQDKLQFVIARDFSEFVRAIDQSKIPVAHAIEGAHALGTNFPVGNDVEHAKWYIRNLEALKARGVCLITIAHIFNNDISPPVEGIAPDSKTLLKMEKYKPDESLSLTEIGKTVVMKMLDLGIIVDLTHSTPAAREEVFKINKRRREDGKKMRPLTFTHSGAQHIFEEYEVECKSTAYDHYKFYDVSDTEIDSIRECNGTIGIIPENFWLIGCDRVLNGPKYKNGIEHIVKTIQYIKTKTKTYNNISIGTDFDGLADAPGDLYKPFQLKDLIEALRKASILDEDINKMMSGNALRLLRDGWGDYP